MLDETSNWLELNRSTWDERTAVHLGPSGYDVSSHLAGLGRLDAIVETELGPVEGLRVLHLQCHIGNDTVALSQRGAAEVVGVDFSAPSVAGARALAAKCGAGNVRFALADVRDAPAALGGEPPFDLVFTTWGTISWYPDLTRWGQVVGHFLRPGGALYFADLHPGAAVFDGLANHSDAEGRPGWLLPYFGRAPQLFDDPTDYADPTARIASSRTVNWLHPLADILGALRGAGLHLDWLHEHPSLPWQMFPGLVRGADRLWTWPGQPWLPLAVSLRAVRR